MAFPMILMAAGAMVMPPEVPPLVVQTIVENHAFVMRSFAGAKPLYTFDQDRDGQSSCNDRCAVAWPPLTASATAKPVGAWSIVTRADGSHQWAFGGKPVYTFAHDEGSVAKGDGMGGMWHLLPVTPAGR